MYCRYPEIVVKVEDLDNNVSLIVKRVRAALVKASVSDLEDFARATNSNDCAHLLITCMKWVTLNPEPQF
jgi:hypothetical protein